MEEKWQEKMLEKLLRKQQRKRALREKLREDNFFSNSLGALRSHLFSKVLKSDI